MTLRRFVGIPYLFKNLFMSPRVCRLVLFCLLTGFSFIAKAQTAPAQLIFCEDTDNKFNPIKPVTSIAAGEGVNYLVKLKESIGIKAFTWAAYEIKDNGDEVFFKDLQENVENEQSHWFATTKKTVFPRPGKYAVYIIPKNTTGAAIGKPVKYYARGVLTVK